jgi:apolipoprotein N-acyltransferase
VSNRVTQKNRSVFYHHQKKIISAPVICYESIYGEFSTEYIRLGADFLAVISNDAWWGNTQGHKQLLSYTRLRAIENRRSIARSANTGISALINENGEYLKKLDYGLEGTIAGEIPIVEKITFYTKYGDYIGRISFLIFLLYFSVAVSGRFKKKIHNF